MSITLPFMIKRECIPDMPIGKGKDYSYRLSESYQAKKSKANRRKAKRRAKAR